MASPATFLPDTFEPDVPEGFVADSPIEHVPPPRPISMANEIQKLDFVPTDTGIQDTLRRQINQGAPNMPFHPEAGTGLTTSIGESVPTTLPEAWRVASEPLLNPQPSPSDIEFRKRHPVIGGIESGVSDLAKGFTSPIGIATLGIGALPRTAQRIISGAFAAQMAAATPEIARELGTEFGLPEDQRDYQKISHLITTAVGTGAFTALAGKHALTELPLFKSPLPPEKQTTPYQRGQKPAGYRPPGAGEEARVPTPSPETPPIVPASLLHSPTEQIGDKRRLTFLEKAAAGQVIGPDEVIPELVDHLKSLNYTQNSDGAWIPPALTLPAIGAPNASDITSPAGVPQPEVRPLVGQEAPLRQQGEVAGTPPVEPVAPLPAPQAAEANPVVNEVAPASQEPRPVTPLVEPVGEWVRWVNLLDELTPLEKERAIKNLADATPEELERWRAKLFQIQLMRKVGDSTSEIKAPKPSEPVTPLVEKPTALPVGETPPAVPEVKPEGWSDERWSIFKKQRQQAIDIQAERDAEFEQRQAILQNRSAQPSTERPTPSPESAAAALPTEPASPVEGSVTPKVTEASPPTEGEIVGMGGAVPSEFEPARKFTTRNTVEQINKERKERGVPPLEEHEVFSNKAAVAEAERRMDEDFHAADKIVERLRQKPETTLDPPERAIMAIHRAQLKNAQYRALKNLSDHLEGGDTERAAVESENAEMFGNQLTELDSLVGEGGSSTAAGLSLQAVKIGIREDFSLDMMILKKAKAKKRPLTKDEKLELLKANERIMELEKRLEIAETKGKESDTGEATSELVKQTKKRQASDKASGTVRDLDVEQKEVIDHLKETFIEEGGIEGESTSIRKLMELLVEKEGITQRLPMETRVHEILRDLVDPTITREQAMDLMSGYGKSRLPSPDFAKRTVRDINAQIIQVRKLLDYFKGEHPKLTGQLRDAPSDIQRMWNRMVNEAKKAFKLEATPDNAKSVKSALDAIKTRLRNRLKDLKQEVATRQKIVRGKTAAPYDEETLRLRKEIEEVKKAHDEIFGGELTDAERLTLAEKSADRQITELERQLSSGEIFPKSKVPFAGESPKLTAAKAKIEELKQQRQFARESVQPRPEPLQVKIESKVKSLDKQIAEIENQIADETVFAKGKTEKPSPTDARVIERQKKLDALKEQRQFIRDRLQPRPEQAAKELQARAESLGKQITEVERQIRDGDIFPKGKTVTPKEKNDLIRAREAELEALKEQRQWAREAAQPKAEPNEKFLLNYLLRLRQRAAEIQERTAKGDFSKRVKVPRELSPDVIKAKADVEKAKQDFNRGLVLDEMKHRTPLEKTQDALVKWRRAAILSSPVTLAKLTSAAVQRMVFSGVEEGLGGILSKAIPRISEKAPREGGLSPSAEAKAITDGFTKGMRDGWQTLKTGRSELDVLYGKPDLIPRSAIDFFGHLHGALKAQTKRNEFARSFQKRTEQAIRNGIDPKDPMVQTSIALESYKDAQKAIFMQDNRVVAGYKRLVGAWEEKNKSTGKVPLSGKALATTANVLLPIVKIPTNIVAETMQYAMGSVTGSARLANAFRTGIENLKPEQADLIMRDLKKGSLGTAVLLLGYFSADSVGGYYQAGEKRKPGDVKYGAVRIFGHDIPSYLVHNPLLETLQIGATVRRVADSKFKKSDTETQGIPSGLAAGALGLIDEVPFVREMAEVSKAFNPRDRGAFVGELSKSIVVPQLFEWTARQMDIDSEGETIKRKPVTHPLGESIKQHIETAIPVMRENVPKSK